MILEQKVKMTWNKSTKRIYVPLGYEFTNFGDEFEIDVKDLSPNSHLYVMVQCDYCGEIFKMCMQSYTRGMSEVQKCSCKNPECLQKKIREVNMKRYGVANVTMLPEVQAKIRHTCIERFGVDYPAKCDVVKEKIRETCRERYGTDYYAQTEDAQRRFEATCMERYGVRRPLMNEEILKKSQATCMENWGVDNPTKNPEILHKAIVSRREYSGTPSSLQQKHICEVLNLYENYPFSVFYFDCADLSNMIDVEYNGGGHDLSVKFGEETREYFDNRWLYRLKLAVNKGWKVLEICSTTDTLPDDSMIISIYEYSLLLFDIYNHVKVDIDNFTIKYETITSND